MKYEYEQVGTLWHVRQVDGAMLQVAKDKTQAALLVQRYEVIEGLYPGWLKIQTVDEVA